MTPPTSVIVLGYGEEEYLERCLSALVGELSDEDELLLVDNAIAHSSQRLPALPSRVTVIGDGTNRGFAGGCNFAAEHAKGEVLVFVNSDAIVRPGSLGALVAAAAEEGAGIAGGCLRLADEPDKVNSVGNPLQFLGVTWAGACGESASQHLQRTRVAVATGGFFALRREVWEDLGGFDPLYFAYHEDTDLSLRCWMSGRPVTFIPDAVADHYYEFSRNPFKMYLVERNRMVTVLTDYPAPVLRAVLPMLLLLEPAFLVMALMQGWARQKLRAWWWLVRQAGSLRRRRRRVQAALAVPPLAVAELMCSRIEPPMVEAPAGMGALNRLLEAYWNRSMAALSGEGARGR